MGCMNRRVRLLPEGLYDTFKEKAPKKGLFPDFTETAPKRRPEIEVR